MKIAVASDHAGFELKRSLVPFVEGLGHDVLDLGPFDASRSDYPNFAKKVARAVAEGTVERGLLVCGSGIGMAISANRHRGVRAVAALVALEARLARRHNDANVLCLGARLIGSAMAEDTVRAFLEESFEGGRHLDRVKLIDQDAAFDVPPASSRSSSQK